MRNQQGMEGRPCAREVFEDNWTQTAGEERRGEQHDRWRERERVRRGDGDGRRQRKRQWGRERDAVREGEQEVMRGREREGWRLRTDRGSAAPSGASARR